MADSAATPSRDVRNSTPTSTLTSSRSGRPNPKISARLATPSEVLTTTCCPLWYPVLSAQATSTIFTLDSEALQ